MCMRKQRYMKIDKQFRVDYVCIVLILTNFLKLRTVSIESYPLSNFDRHSKSQVMNF